MGVIKHIEFEIEPTHDLTCWGKSLEDFPEKDDFECAKGDLIDYISDNYEQIVEKN